MPRWDQLPALPLCQSSPFRRKEKGVVWLDSYCSGSGEEGKGQRGSTIGQGLLREEPRRLLCPYSSRGQTSFFSTLHPTHLSLALPGGSPRAVWAPILEGSHPPALPLPSAALSPQLIEEGGSRPRLPHLSGGTTLVCALHRLPQSLGD